MYNRIRDLREDRDMKQKDIAEYLCCTQQAYSNYETGTRNIPSDMLIKLAELYLTNIDYIMGLTDNKKYYKDL
ncbi:MAG: helix-turn-helix transcriptional regulator [Firmicutes bacterium]|nr:helix-turn-helix transcriptional regulator [Bacillota bacterium]